jgi:hypothetical protein
MRPGRVVAIAPSTPVPGVALELSGPKLRQAFASLVASAEEHGGVERYVEALRVKSRLFGEFLADGKARHIELGALKALCALMATVRRRVGQHLEATRFEAMRMGIAALLEGSEDTSTTDERIDAFCGRYPADRAHRWVRDLAAEVLHQVDPERYPLMMRWVWDRHANTGVLREVWHADDVDQIMLSVPDGYDTFLMLRQELSHFLAQNGVFRDVLQYVDLLTTQVYATYIGEQGGSYLRTDFSAPEDTMVHVRRMLGLDGVDATGRTRLKLAAGEVFTVDDPKLPN